MKKRVILLLVLWLFVMVGYVFYRSSLPMLVWEDSTIFTKYLYDSSSPNVVSGDSFAENIRESFQSIGETGYRPLSVLQKRMGSIFFAQHAHNPILWFFGVSIIIGITAVCLFLVARRFLMTDLAALCVVLLVLFSTPFITASWLVLAGLQSLVLLTISLGLLLYWKSRSGSHVGKWRIGLALILLLGPWLREFIGILSLLILFEELRQKKKVWLLICMAALAFVHAVFPMAIVRLLIFPHMILESVFLVGTLNARLVEFWSKNNDLFLMLPMLNFYIQRLIINFYSLYPPLLWICFGMAASFRLIYKPDVRDLQKAENRDVPLIWVWFLLSFLPFIVVYTEQVHLMYALVPASIIMIRAVEYLFIYVWRVKFFCNYLLRLLLIVMVSVIASDHILNLYGSWRVVQGINKGISNVGDWFEKNTPSQSIVICNVLHGEDIRLTSHNHVQIFWTRRGGHPRVEESLDSEAALKAFLEKIPATQTVYFLDIRFPYTYRGIQYFHEHEYLNTPDIALQNMGLIYTSQIRYPYVDPLKVFIPPWAISFLGAPDLENDFYRGPCRDGKAFCREVYAEYHLYKLLAPRPSSRL